MNERHKEMKTHGQKQITKGPQTTIQKERTN